jgi:hypothetical protein
MTITLLKSPSIKGFILIVHLLKRPCWFKANSLTELFHIVTSLSLYPFFCFVLRRNNSLFINKELFPIGQKSVSLEQETFYSRSESFTPKSIYFTSRSNTFISRSRTFISRSKSYNSKNRILNSRSNTFISKNRIFTPRSDTSISRSRTFTPFKYLVLIGRKSLLPLSESSFSNNINF